MINSKRPRELGLLITVGGPGKSGSSTIAKMLANHFGLTRIYAGQMMKDYAKSKGFINVLDFLNTVSDKELEEIDHKIDSKMLKFAYQSNILLEGKGIGALVTMYQVPVTVRIWLDASLEIRAKRSVQKGDIVETEQELIKRQKQDEEKFKRAYGIDYSSPKKYNDIVIDTSRMNEYQTFTLILKLIEDGRYIRK